MEVIEREKRKKMFVALVHPLHRSLICCLDVSRPFSLDFSSSFLITRVYAGQTSGIGESRSWNLRRIIHKMMR